MLLWRIYVAGYNKMYCGLHVKCTIIWSDFNQIWSFWRDFYVNPQYKFSRKSVPLEPQ